MPFFIGKNILRLKRIDSTNNYLKELLADKDNAFLHEGTVVVAEDQYKGRGQRGNHWQSDPGKNLTFSVLLSPLFLKAEKQFYLGKVVAVAVTDMLGSVCGASFSIKWPNDILCGKKKIAGLLIENVIRNGKIQHSVAGIGININQTKFENDINAASLKTITGEHFDPDRLLNNCCGFLEKRYLSLRDNRYGQIDQTYLERMFSLGEKQEFRKGEEQFTAEVLGVSDTGKLRLLRSDGEVRYGFGEVEYLLG